MRVAASAAAKGRSYYTSNAAIFVHQYLTYKMLHGLGFTHDPNQLDSIESEILSTINNEFIVEQNRQADERQKAFDDSLKNKGPGMRRGGSRARRR